MANTFVFDDEEPQPEAAQPAPETPEPIPPSEGGTGGGRNRTFLIAAGVLGALVLLTLVCMAVYAFAIRPGITAAAEATNQANIAANTKIAMANDAATQAAAVTATLPPTDTPAPLPTETLVVNFASATPSPIPTLDPGTATLQALQTQLFMQQQDATSTQQAMQTGTAGTTGTPGKKITQGTSGTAGSPGSPGTPGTPGTSGTPGSGQLAQTGFGDQYGLPSLFLAAILVVLVIMLTRRLRQSHQDD